MLRVGTVNVSERNSLWVGKLVWSFSMVMTEQNYIGNSETSRVYIVLESLVKGSPDNPDEICKSKTYQIHQNSKKVMTI